MDSKWRFEQLRILASLRGFALLMAAGAAIVLFQNCSSSHSTAENASLSAQDQTLALQNTSIEILAGRCYSCHNPNNPNGSIADITDVDELLYKRLIIPGEPQLSLLFTEVQSGSMPQNSGPLEASLVKILNDWIIALKAAPPPGGGTVITLGPTYSAVNNLIIKPKCLNCHNSASAAGGVSFSTYAQLMNTIVAGNPGASVFYTEIMGNTMPPNGPLSQAEKDAVMQWITAGAPQQ